VPPVGELRARHTAAVALLADGRSDQAAREFRAVVDGARRHFGMRHPDTLTVEGNLAVTYLQCGREEDGARLLASNLASREITFGQEHESTLRARDALAAAHRLAGRLPDALWLYARVAAQRNEALGPDHPDTLITRLGLALTLADSGDEASAIELVDAAWRDSLACHGTLHSHTALLRYHLDLLRDDASVDDDATVDAVIRPPEPRAARHDRMTSAAPVVPSATT
jgi:hypothetical protein